MLDSEDGIMPEDEPSTASLADYTPAAHLQALKDSVLRFLQSADTTASLSWEDSGYPSRASFFRAVKSLIVPVSDYVAWAEDGDGVALRRREAEVPRLFTPEMFSEVFPSERDTLAAVGMKVLLKRGVPMPAVAIVDYLCQKGIPESVTHSCEPTATQRDEGRKRLEAAMLRAVPSTLRNLKQGKLNCFWPADLPDPPEGWERQYAGMVSGAAAGIKDSANVVGEQATALFMENGNESLRLAELARRLVEESPYAEVLQVNLNSPTAAFVKEFFEREVFLSAGTPQYREYRARFAVVDNTSQRLALKTEYYERNRTVVLEPPTPETPEPAKEPKAATPESVAPSLPCHSPTEAVAGFLAGQGEELFVPANAELSPIKATLMVSRAGLRDKVSVENQDGGFLLVRRLNVPVSTGEAAGPDDLSAGSCLGILTSRTTRPGAQIHLVNGDYILFHEGRVYAITGDIVEGLLEADAIS